MSPYEMVFDQKPRKPIMFTASAHKNTQDQCQQNKDSISYNLPLHTHDEDHFHHPQILKLASQKGISKKLQPLRKRPYQIIDKPTEITYKLTDSTKRNCSTS